MRGARDLDSQTLHGRQVGMPFGAMLVPLLGTVFFRVVTAETLAMDPTPILFALTNVPIVVVPGRYRMRHSGSPPRTSFSTTSRTAWW